MSAARRLALVACALLSACGGAEEVTPWSPCVHDVSGEPIGDGAAGWADAPTQDAAGSPGQDVGVVDHDAPQPDASTLDIPMSDTGSDTGADAAQAPLDGSAFEPGPSPCAEVEAFGPVYQPVVERFQSQDALAPWPDGPVVFVGSSSIRRWETLALSYSDYAPIQRGIGGAQAAEVALFAGPLVTALKPRAVVVYAGTNDVSFGVPVDVVVERTACLRWRIGDALGWGVPVLVIGITPNPARWEHWDKAATYNQAVAVMAADDPGLGLIDVAPPFLETGEPPEAALFDPDGLHLSPAGYALWHSVIRPRLEAVVPPTPAASEAALLPAGTRLLIDLGPTNPEDGEVTPSPDYLGQHWNNWHDVEGGVGVLAGERLPALITSTGVSTDISLVIAGGFLGNGRSHGGLLWPEQAKLDGLAVGSATGDFFYVENADSPGALQLRGLDPSATYTLRLFASRAHEEVRVTRFTAQGQPGLSVTLQTSGGGGGNDDTVAHLSGLTPDAWGHLYLDVAIDSGTYAYLSVLELIVE